MQSLLDIPVNRGGITCTNKINPKMCRLIVSKTGSPRSKLYCNCRLELKRSDKKENRCTRITLFLRAFQVLLKGSELRWRHRRCFRRRFRSFFVGSSWNKQKARRTRQAMIDVWNLMTNDKSTRWCNLASLKAITSNFLLSFDWFLYLSFCLFSWFSENYLKLPRHSRLKIHREEANKSRTEIVFRSGG